MAVSVVVVVIVVVVVVVLVVVVVVVVVTVCGRRATHIIVPHRDTARLGGTVSGVGVRSSTLKLQRYSDSESCFHTGSHWQWHSFSDSEACQCAGLALS